MASSEDLIKYICEQISSTGDVGYKKMFGEYMIYLNAKPVFTICNDTVYVKINDKVTQIVGEDCEQGSPYNGAKPHFIIADIDDREFMSRLASVIEEITPLPKPRKKKIKEIK